MTLQRRRTDTVFSELDPLESSSRIDIDLRELEDLAEDRYRALFNQHIAALNRTIEQSKKINELIATNEHLYKLAYFDKLTGLPNQRLLEDSFDKAVTNGDSIVLLFIDLDRFKKINDTYGHHIGDEALKLASKTLLSMTRQTDVVAHIDEITIIEERSEQKHLPVRYAGDEFVILFVGATSAELANKVGQIREAFANLRLKLGPEHGNIEIPVGASIGAYERKEGDTLETCKKIADKAMYEAKSSGRDADDKSLSYAFGSYSMPKAQTIIPDPSLYSFLNPEPR